MPGTPKLDVLKAAIIEDFSKSGSDSYYVSCGWRLRSLRNPALVSDSTAITLVNENSVDTLDNITGIEWAAIIIEEVSSAIGDYTILIARGDDGWDEIVELIETSIEAVMV